MLFPAPIRDLLMQLAMTGLFRARWSAMIHDEWTRSVLRVRPELTAVQLSRTRQLMDSLVLDALVTGFEPLIDALDLPDPDDRHVLAAAIRCGADAIVTYNLKDFPEHALSTYGIEAIHPDSFIVSQLDLAPSAKTLKFRPLFCRVGIIDETARVLAKFLASRWTLFPSVVR